MILMCCPFRSISELTFIDLLALQFTAILKLNLDGVGKICVSGNRKAECGGGILKHTLSNNMQNNVFK